MRLFIAIQLNDRMKRTAEQVQDSFRRQLVRGRFTPKENLHLTLAFIGEFDDPEAVLDAMERIRFSPFTIQMNKVGHFDDLWWAGFAESAELNGLVRSLRHALSDMGIPFDKKRFRAHCTLLRNASFAGGHPMEQVIIKPVSMKVERICLMQSTRGKQGMIYTELGAVPSESPTL